MLKTTIAVMQPLSSQVFDKPIDCNDIQATFCKLCQKWNTLAYKGPVPVRKLNITDGDSCHATSEVHKCFINQWTVMTFRQHSKDGSTHPVYIKLACFFNICCFFSKKINYLSLDQYCHLVLSSELCYASTLNVNSC